MSEWTVPVPDVLVEGLRHSLEYGPILDDQGQVAFKKRLVDKINGLKVEIFSNEHPPPHFRVRYGEESNNFTIKDCQPLSGSGLQTYFRNIRKWHA